MKMGIIGAMDYEVTLLIEQMVGVKHIVKAGNTFHAGKLADKAVVVVECGIGKVNAAQCTQMLISEFGVSHIINTGVAGAIKDFLNVGDIVVSTDLVQHDYDVTSGGDYQYGQIPRMDEWIFVADETLCKLAMQAASQVDGNNQVYQDRIVSGDQFVASSERKVFILDNFNAAATEMEGAAIAHVSYLNDIPFVIIRAMSDKADGSAHVNFEEFAKRAAVQSAQIVVAMLTELS